MELVVRNLTVEDGLPSSEVYMVTQDSKGYMWFSTDRGVARFDGQKFTTFTTKEGLCDNTVFGIHEDPHGKLWFRTMSGKLSYWDGEQIQNPNYNEELSKAVGHTLILDLSIDSNGNQYINTGKSEQLFVSSSKSLQVYDPGEARDSSIRVTINDDGSVFSKYFLAESSPSGIPSKTYNNLSSFYIKDLVIIQPTGQTDIIPVNLNTPKLITRSKAFITSKGHIIIAMGGLLLQIDKNRLLSSFRSNNRFSGAISEDSHGGLWVGTLNSGVLAFSNGDLTQEPLNYLKNQSITSVFSDTEENLWFSSLESGVFFSRNPDALKIATTDNNDQVRCKRLISDGNELWAGLSNGTLLNWKSDQPIEFNTGVGETQDLLIGKHNGLWIAGTSGTLYKPKLLGSFTKRVPSIRRLAKSPGGSVFGLKSGSQGFVLLQLYPALKRINLHKDAAEHNARSIIFDTDESLWIGTTRGLLKLSLSDTCFDNMSRQDFRLSSRIEDFALGHSRFLFIATMGQGVLVLKDDVVVLQLNEANGLLSDQCSSILFHGQDTLLVATNKGISKVVFVGGEYKSFSVEGFTKEEGLSSNQVSDLATWKGRIWAATNQGVCSFPATWNPFPPHHPPTYITSVSINGRDTSRLSLYHLAHDQNDIQINYIGLSFRHSGNIRYRYRLVEQDSSWKNTDQLGLQFSALSPGHYTFQLQTSAGFGPWSKNPASVVFVINPPWWQSWWALSISGVVFILGFWRLFKWRIGIIKKTEEEKTKIHQQLSKLESQALRAQMNPHFIFNTMNAIQNYINSSPKEEAQQYLGQFSRLIRKILDHSSKDWVTLKEDLDALELYMALEAKRFGGRISFQLVVDPNLDVGYDRIPPMIIQPFVENAIWHGLSPKEDNGSVVVQLKCLNNNTVLCIVEDNGVGRQANYQKDETENSEHTSFGMSITENRLKTLSKNAHAEHIKVIDLKDDSGNSAGTRVEIHVPLQ